MYRKNYNLIMPDKTTNFKKRATLLSQVVLESEKMIEKIDSLICSAYTPEYVFTDLTRERTLLAIETMKMKNQLLMLN